MKTRHALITGGAGFIGSHLCDHLLAGGWEITAVDNFSTGRPENIAHLKDNQNFHFIEGDVQNYELMEDLGDKVDSIFHLAAVVGVQKVVEDPVGTIETNHAATKTVLHVARRHNLRVVITSSSEVYGANPSAAFFEDDICSIGPTSQRRWGYSASKLLDEFHAFSYFYAYNTPITVVRLFNTIGPRQVGAYGMVVPRFVRQALSGEAITIYGDGEQCRCFTWVGDVANCLRLLMESDNSAGRVFNIGSTEEISINALAALVQKLTGCEVPLVYQDYRQAYGEDFADVEHRCPDTTRLRDTIGIAPATLLDESLEQVIDSIRSELGAK